MRVLTRVDAFGERIAAVQRGTRWAVAYGDRVTLWDGTEPAGEMPRAVEQILDLRYTGDVLLAAPLRAADEAWENLPPLISSIEPWRPIAATWAADRLLVAVSAPANGHEQEVRLYDGLTRQPEAVLWADRGWTRVEAVAAGHDRLAAASLEVRVWEAESLQEVLVVPERGRQVRTIALAGDEVVVGYADGHVAVHGRADWEAHDDEACAVVLHPDGERVATGGWDGRVALWTLDGELVEEANVGAEVADLAFLASDQVLALHRLPETGVSVLSLAS